MRCQYCGREAQPGQVYCECGHPISLSGNTGFQQGGGFPQDGFSQGGFQQGFTPDGRDLYSLQKKSGMGLGGKILIMILVLALLGGGGFLAYKFIKGRDPLDESSWKKIDKAEFSITLPISMKESDNIVDIGSGYKRLAFYKGDKTAAYLAKYDNTNVTAMIKSQGIEGTKAYLIENLKRRKINNHQLEPKTRGDLITVEYPVQRKNYIKDTDKLWMLDATLVTDTFAYEIEFFCAESEKDKYIDAMYKWADSFKAK